MLTVHLHVGAMKSGTTYLQRVLESNRALLRERGVLIPGRRWRDQVAGVEELIDRRPKGKPKRQGAWQRLLDDIAGFTGEAAIISMETLSFADDAAVARAVESLQPYRVRVILTARDLRRVVPAQWQEATQNGATFTYERFLQAASKTRSRRIPIARTLWAAQDFGHTLRTWQPVVSSPEDLVVVTVPPPGAPTSLLWERFCAAAELDPSGVQTPPPVNESLGSTSAELMRRINEVARSADASYLTRQALKQQLAKAALPQRRAQEPSLVLPSRYLPWAVRTAQWQIDEITATGAQVIGDLTDLAVSPDETAEPGRGKTVESPSTSDTELLDAAITGLIGVAGLGPRRGRRKRRAVTSQTGEDDG